MSSEPESSPRPEDQSHNPASPTDGGEGVNREETARRKIKIGSQRDTRPISSARPTPPPLDIIRTSETPVTPAADKTPADAKSQAEEDKPVDWEVAAREAANAPSKPIAPPAEAELPTPPVEVAGRLSADLEREIEEALGGMSLDQLLAGETQTKMAAAEDLAPETRLKATVVKVDRDNVFFSLGGRNEGIAGLAKFAKEPKPGEMLDVVVQKFDAEEGLYEVTVPGAALDVGDWSDVQEGMVVEARITGHNQGGLECEVSHLRGFIPASQVALYRVENFAEFVGQKLACVITEANPERRNLVLSRRAMLEREREANKQEQFGKLEVGQTHEGTVRKLMDFGAFVELSPGIDGLIHVSQMSWDRVNHPSEVLSEGQKVKVKIDKIDANTGKIALSYRDSLENPWAKAALNYPLGTVVKGTVSRIAQFGAFVKLEPGVEGLVHISELAHYRVQRVNSVVQEGQEVEVKVVQIDPDAQRMGLSMKAIQQAPQAAKAEKEAEEETPEPPRELAVKARKGPLKGGTNKKTGGEELGLKW